MRQHLGRSIVFIYPDTRARINIPYLIVLIGLRYQTSCTRIHSGGLYTIEIIIQERFRQTLYIIYPRAQIPNGVKIVSDILHTIPSASIDLFNKSIAIIVFPCRNNAIPIYLLKHTFISIHFLCRPIQGLTIRIAHFLQVSCLSIYIIQA
ncbi:hypothetical protein YQ44_10635 [Janthinobacterium sp. 1_2014MBL_MicDiv]|nr:hypothetical protein YQ44_10635 [Janthinobacterium sp. 1_2014MBL_MicDiv]